MVEILTLRESLSSFEQLIFSSKEKLNLFIPIFKFSENIFTLLQKADERGVKITIVFNTDELTAEEKIMISALKNIEVYHYPELNSRSYYNEDKMLFSSINFTDFNKNMSGEMSVLISRKNDLEMYNKAVSIYDSIIKESIMLVSSTGIDHEAVQNEQKYHGFCIRCAMPIDYNINKPYCRQCMNERKAEGVTSSPEKYCHACAQKADVSESLPLCSKCS